MTATEEERYKAQELEDKMKQRKSAADDEVKKIKDKAKQLRGEADKKKDKARLREFRAGGQNMNQLQRANEIRKAAELGSEANDLKHQAKDLEHQAYKLDQDSKFERKQTQKEINKLRA